VELVWVLPAAIVLGAGIRGVWIFNRLVGDRNLVKTGFADIDVQLQRRHDLVPRLVVAVEGYAAFERRVLEEVADLRGRARSAGRGEIEERNRAERALVAGMGRLIAIAEAYPDLKASENFRRFMADLVDVENHLQQARRFYNGAVRQLNTRVQRFPDLVVARLFGFRTAEFFSAEIEARAVPEVRRLLGHDPAG
jgi:LemA protein